MVAPHLEELLERIHRLGDLLLSFQGRREPEEEVRVFLVAFQPRARRGRRAPELVEALPCIRGHERAGLVLGGEGFEHLHALGLLLGG